LRWVPVQKDLLTFSNSSIVAPILRRLVPAPGFFTKLMRQVLINVDWRKRTCFFLYMGRQGTLAQLITPVCGDLFGFRNNLAARFCGTARREWIASGCDFSRQAIAQGPPN
jgi:hypothetical protein